MEHDEVAVLTEPGEEFQHPPCGVSADDEKATVGINQADGVGKDAVASG